MARTVLRHGFKAEAERTAAAERAALGLPAWAPLAPHAVAERLGVVVRTPQDSRNLAPEALIELLEGNPRAWSSVTVRTPGGQVIVHNPTHERGRQHANITHELAHILLRHTLGRLHTVGDAVLRDYDAVQEAEAACLGETLLVPKAALLAARRRRLTFPQIATELGASLELVTYRWRITGLARAAG